jgi:hypothetical protein
VSKRKKKPNKPEHIEETSEYWQAVMDRAFPSPRAHICTQFNKLPFHTGNWDGEQPPLGLCDRNSRRLGEQCRSIYLKAGRVAERIIVLRDHLHRKYGETFKKVETDVPIENLVNARHLLDEADTMLLFLEQEFIQNGLCEPFGMHKLRPEE